MENPLKLRPLPQREVISVLKGNGFKQVRSGKHITFKRVDSNGKVWTTWVPHHREVTLFARIRKYNFLIGHKNFALQNFSCFEIYNQADWKNKR